MDRTTLIKIAKDLHREVLDAKSYYLIMQQYQKNQHDYEKEMEISPTFYKTVYKALMKACFMEIAKLYDKSNDAISIGFLLAECKENQSFFPEYKKTITVEYDGITCSYQIHYQHLIKPHEECFFKDLLKKNRELLAALDIPDAENNVPPQVNLTFLEILELYQKRFNGLSKKRKNIQMQRNKFYAHNDKKRIVSNENLLDHYCISYSDVQELIDFALDCTELILGVLIDVNHVLQHAKNTGDWESTLMLTRLGLKYREYDLRQEEKAFEADMQKTISDS